MTTDYDRFLNKHVLHARNRLEKAKVDLAEELAEAQSKCSHEIVAYCDYEKLEYLSSLKPLRLCLECRLVEEAHYLFAKVDSEWLGKVYALNPAPDRIYITLTRRTLYSLRIL